MRHENKKSYDHFISINNHPLKKSSLIIYLPYVPLTPNPVINVASKPALAINLAVNPS